ncbi:hypothetical protein BWD08_11195, partial [Neisseria animaloris]|uniref:hypothetical protein n=1 Tax=Neisseria animaloris TaxID=326522 RepID=UPI000A2358D3
TSSMLKAASAVLAAIYPCFFYSAELRPRRRKRVAMRGGARLGRGVFPAPFSPLFTRKKMGGTGGVGGFLVFFLEQGDKVGPEFF